MAKTCTYLNFERETEVAFNFYKSVFGTEFETPPMRFGDFEGQEGMHPVAEADKNLIMHIALPILGDHLLMGTDAPESMGFKMVFGNNVYLYLAPDSKAETDRLFAALSEGGKVDMEMQDMFWGDYFGSCIDQFGVQWMFNYNENQG